MQQPTVADYYGLKFASDNLHDDITRVQDILARPPINPEDLVAVPSLMQGAGDLQAAIQDYTTKTTDLRQLKLKYTDSYKPVQDLQAPDHHAADGHDSSAGQSVPHPAPRHRPAVERAHGESAALGDAVARNRDRRDAPPGRRDAELADLQRTAGPLRRGAARAAECDPRRAGTGQSDRAALSELTTPSRVSSCWRSPPASDSGSRWPCCSTAWTDAYAIPNRRPTSWDCRSSARSLAVKPRLGDFDAEEAAQVVEAFRTIRLNILHLTDPDGPIVFTITSPGAGDGKSLISSNLGMSFAESGRRTLIVDGDIRRGQLHSTFGVHQSPGLLDYLTGNSSLEEILQETDYERLTIVTCGGRRHRGPELLASQAMLQFLSAVRPHYDTIIVDSPPLGAGIDPFALGAATGNLIMILRIGKSDRQMAQAKLAMLERYPVRVLGAVLNDVKAEGAFRYYSYLYGYELDDGEQRAQLPSRVGEVATS